MGSCMLAYMWPVTYSWRRAGWYRYEGYEDRYEKRVARGALVRGIDGVNLRAN